MSFLYQTKRLASNDCLGRVAERAHHPIAEIDQRQAKQFGHVKGLGQPKSCRGASNARKYRARGDKDVPHDACPILSRAATANCGENRAAHQEDDGVQVYKWANEPYPMPGENATRWPKAFDERVVTIGRK